MKKEKKTIVIITSLAVLYVVSVLIANTINSFNDKYLGVYDCVEERTDVTKYPSWETGTTIELVRSGKATVITPAEIGLDINSNL